MSNPGKLGFTSPDFDPSTSLATEPESDSFPAPQTTPLANMDEFRRLARINIDLSDSELDDDHFKHCAQERFKRSNKKKDAVEDKSTLGADKKTMDIAATLVPTRRRVKKNVFTIMDSCTTGPLSVL